MPRQRPLAGLGAPSRQASRHNRIPLDQTKRRLWPMSEFWRPDGVISERLPPARPPHPHRPPLMRVRPQQHSRSAEPPRLLPRRATARRGCGVEALPPQRSKTCKPILLLYPRTPRPGPSPSRSSSGLPAGPAAPFTKTAATPKPAPSASIGTASRTVPPAGLGRSSAPKSRHSAPVVCGATRKRAICPDTERRSMPSSSTSSSPPTPAKPSSPSPTSPSSAALLPPSRTGG